MAQLPAAAATALGMLLGLPVQPVVAADNQPRLQGGQGHYSITLLVPVPPARAWSVLTNYEALAGVMPDIQQATVISRRGPSLVLAQTYRAPYTFGLAIKAQLQLEETPPRQLRYRLISGDRIRRLQGLWTLTPMPGGTLLRHQIDLEPDLPSFLRPTYDDLSQANLLQSMAILRRLMLQR